jgi:ABC-type antimicrobial peptide transport system permease subunit
LAGFYAVENAYLAIFMVLGGFGVALGTLGLAIVVARNLEETRRERAMLRALGYTAGSITRIPLTEHGLAVVAGAAVGLLSALPPILSSLADRGTVPAPGLIVSMVFGIIAVSVLWVALATRIAGKSNYRADLREE